jgi:tetratricopeptide (TPR) repeat protein
MKRCPYCGAKNKSAFEYCVRCSEPLDEASPEGAIAQTRSRLNYLVVGGVSAVVALALAALVARPTDTDEPARPEGTGFGAAPRPVPAEPVRPPAPVGSGLENYRAGLDAYNQGDYETAIVEFERAVRDLPENPTAHAYLGLSHYFLGEYHNAIPALEESLALRPTSFGYLDYLVTSCKKAGELERAVSVLNDFLHANPDAVSVRVELARVARETGDYAESLRQTQLLRAEFGDTAEFAYEQAATLQESGEIQAAKDVLREAIGLAPEEPRVHHALGLIELSSGNPERAIESLEAATARAPTNGDYLFDLAQAYEKSDRIEDSLAAYERYLENARPDDERAPVVAERLEVAKNALARRRRAGQSGATQGPSQ